MASTLSTGSPRVGRKTTPSMKILDEGSDDGNTPTGHGIAVSRVSSASVNVTPTPLNPSKLANLPRNSFQGLVETKEAPPANQFSKMEDILVRLRLNEPRKPGSSNVRSTSAAATNSSLDRLFTNLNDQTRTLQQPIKEVKEDSNSDRPKETDRSSGSELFTPDTEAFDVISTKEAHGTHDDDYAFHGQQMAQQHDVLALKEELKAVRSRMHRQEQELEETRNLKHTMDQAMGPPSEADFATHHEISEQTIGHLQSAFNASARPFTSRNDSWVQQQQQIHRPDGSDGFGIGNFDHGRAGWNNRPQAQFASGLTASAGPMPIYGNNRASHGPDRAWNHTYGSQMSPAFDQFPVGQRNFSGSSVQSFGFDDRSLPSAPPQYNPNMNIGVRRNLGPYNRGSSSFTDPNSPYSSWSPGFPGLHGAPLSSVSSVSGYGYQPRPIGTPLSPAFPPSVSQYSVGPGFATPMSGMSGEWSSVPSSMLSSSFLNDLEPTNYRRLLDKSVSCDWKFIVDKIVCNNDQQASIFLQQKLKVGTAEQKYDIVEAIVNQAYPLMINRFGNFLVQRCFEHGTPEQVVNIANAIHGNVLPLSMDAFGCHVIQKAFDSVPEQNKADMVRELLRRIPDTVIHRYACHVWQKLFELRWSGEPPQIMLKVNEALRGMWHEVALGETGSLVVQNIFENCVEEEKRPAIEEVIASIDLVAHGQFGNWCIQHLCEHGSPSDKRRVIDHILVNSYSYSIDQFASKVVEKCLKIGGVEFLDRYLAVITSAPADRPRIPLIDIAGDQYGNYLIQWILTNTHHHQREQVAIHIRKHMVSLRGSKFGSRVAMLCCNPAQVTRPGPGVAINPYGAPGQPRGWARYR